MSDDSRSADPPRIRPSGGPEPAIDERARRRARLTMIGLFGVFLAPVIAAYVAYFVLPPAGRTNYGVLVEPQRPMGAVALMPAAGASGDVGQGARFDRWHGRWLLVTAAKSACDDDCRARLYAIRQVRLTTGRDRDRVERLWVLLDDGAPPAALLGEHAGMAVARMPGAEFDARFPSPDGAAAAHVFLVDPMGNLMMRFPAPVDPNRLKKDLLRLLKVSRIG